MPKNQASFGASAWLELEPYGAFDASTYESTTFEVVHVEIKSFTANAVLRHVPSFNADAILKKIGAQRNFSAQAYLLSTSKGQRFLAINATLYKKPFPGFAVSAVLTHTNTASAPPNLRVYRITSARVHWKE